MEPRLKKEGTANSGSLDPKQEIMMYRRSWDARDMTTPEPPYKATAVQRRRVPSGTSGYLWNLKIATSNNKNRGEEIRWVNYQVAC